MTNERRTITVGERFPDWPDERREAWARGEVARLTDERDERAEWVDYFTRPGTARPVVAALLRGGWTLDAALSHADGDCGQACGCRFV